MRKKYDIRVSTRSSRPRIEEQADHSLWAWLHAAPLEGKANAELIELLAEHFNVAKSLISISSGLTAKKKTVIVDLPE